MQSLDFGTMERGKNQAVFVMIYCKEAMPWLGYSGEIEEELRMRNVPLVFMINRSDGKLGFPGGRMESGETIVEAMLRESKEEVNVVLDEKRLEPLTTFGTDKYNLHSFCYEASHEEIKQMQRNAVHAQHFGSEIAGTVLAQICTYEKNLGYHEFLKNNFIGMTSHALMYLVANKSLFHYART